MTPIEGGDLPDLRIAVTRRTIRFWRPSRGNRSLADLEIILFRPSNEAHQTFVLIGCLETTGPEAHNTGQRQLG